MPWKETDVQKERVKFVLEWERRSDAGEGLLNFSELCREFGVSRDTGHRWVRRYRDAGRKVAVLASRSSRPKTMPTKVAVDVEDEIIKLRKQYPDLGPKKLRAWIRHNAPRFPVPAVSTIADILKRRGMTRSKPRRQRATQANTQPFAEVTGPNATWCVDFKGHFRTEDGNVCYPLTIVDAFSRYDIKCEGLTSPDGREVQRVFDAAFREFGLPAAIRSDNGPPFASTGAGGLTDLAVWWLRLGIRLERIRPGRPQENGRQERFHRTLKAATARPPAATLAAQQRKFDAFRGFYNLKRPHEALGQRPPASVYRASARRYPRPLQRFEVAPWCQAARVDKDGFIRWNKKRLFLSTALRHEDVALAYDSTREVWEVVFGPLCIGELTDGPDGPSFKPSRGRMQDTR